MKRCSCSKFTGKHPCQRVILIKLLTLERYWSHTSTWVFSCKFAAYFQSTLSWEYLLRTGLIIGFCSGIGKKTYLSRKNFKHSLLVSINCRLKRPLLHLRGRSGIALHQMWGKKKGDDLWNSTMPIP